MSILIGTAKFSAASVLPINLLNITLLIENSEQLINKLNQKTTVDDYAGYLATIRTLWDVYVKELRVMDQSVPPISGT